MAADWGNCVGHTYHANFWLAEMSKKSYQNNSSISLTHTQFQNQLFADQCLSTWRRKNWPQKVSRLRITVGSPDTVYRSVIITHKNRTFPETGITLSINIIDFFYFLKRFCICLNLIYYSFKYRIMNIKSNTNFLTPDKNVRVIYCTTSNLPTVLRRVMNAYVSDNKNTLRALSLLVTCNVSDWKWLISWNCFITPDTIVWSATLEILHAQVENNYFFNLVHKVALYQIERNTYAVGECGIDSRVRLR
jgi:hypothetical protein